MIKSPLTFITWKWHVPGSPRLFQSKHVNVVYGMIARWYQGPFRMVCITDDPRGLDSRIEAFPMPAEARAMLTLKNPTGSRFPSCYCRLWIFSRDAAQLGDRLFQLDTDAIIVGDLGPLVDRDEDFVGWTDDRFVWNKIAGGAFMLRAGALPELWEDFDPKRSPSLASSAGFQGSDQGWISYRIAADKRQIGEWRDGLVKLNWTPTGADTAPAGARVVFTNGAKPPWNKDLRNQYPWIRQHWKNEG